MTVNEHDTHLLVHSSFLDYGPTQHIFDNSRQLNNIDDTNKLTGFCGPSVMLFFTSLQNLNDHNMQASWGSRSTQEEVIFIIIRLWLNVTLTHQKVCHIAAAEPRAIFETRIGSKRGEPYEEDSDNSK